MFTHIIYLLRPHTMSSATRTESFSVLLTPTVYLENQGNYGFDPSLYIQLAETSGALLHTVLQSTQDDINYWAKQISKKHEHEEQSGPPQVRTFYQVLHDDLCTCLSTLVEGQKSQADFLVAVGTRLRKVSKSVGNHKRSEKPVSLCWTYEDDGQGGFWPASNITVTWEDGKYRVFTVNPSDTVPRVTRTTVASTKPGVNDKSRGSMV